MASQGPNSPSTLANDNSIGSVAWSNPSNAGASDNSYATAVLTTGTIGNYLKATNFGFSIPSGATIDGIVVEIEKKGSVNSGPARIVDNVVKLVIGGTITGNNKASASAWPTSDTVASYGTSTDLWGTTPTDSDINASTFGVVLAPRNASIKMSITASVDHMKITVYYTGGGGGGGSQTDAIFFAND